MKSKKLEEKADRQRQEVFNAITDINYELSPGRLLERWYFRGEDASFTGFIASMKKDPMPGALIIAAVAWAMGQESSRPSAEKEESSSRQTPPGLNVGLGFSLGIALAALKFYGHSGST